MSSFFGYVNGEAVLITFLNVVNLIPKFTSS